MRRFLARPLSSQPRAFLVILGAVIVTGAPVALSFRGTPAPNPVPPSTFPMTVAPTESGQVSQPQSASSDPERVRAVTRDFLLSYLQVLYGQAVPLSIQDASPELFHQLQSQRGRPSPAQGPLRPRLVDVQVSPQSRDSAISAADIDDGTGVPYAIHMTVVRQNGDWQVVSLNDD